MFNENEKQEITNVLLAFFNELNEWEEYCNKIDKDKSLSFDEKYLKQKEEITLIFNKYCTKKERKFGRPNKISYSHEEIDNVEIIISIQESQTKNKAIVETKENGSEPFLYQYILIKTKNIWQIDSKKRYSSHQKKWVIESL